MSEDNLKPDGQQPQQVSVPRPPQDDDEPLKGEIVDEYNNDFARKANAIPDETWRKIQIIGGIILGLAAGACLFFVKSNPNSFLPMSFILALFLAMVVPNIAEKQLQRKIPTGRMALLISLASVIVVYIIYGFTTGMFLA